MKKLILMFAALCGMLPVMASTDGPPTAASAALGQLNALVDAADTVLAAGGDVGEVVDRVEDQLASAAGDVTQRVNNVSSRGKRWAENIGSFFTDLNKQRRARGISNWDAGFGLGSLGALGTWLAYHGWKTRQARRQLALEKAKSKLATLQKKVQQAKTPEARSQALFEYRKAQHDAIAAFKHKNSWSRDWTDRLRGAWQGHYGWQHQVASAIAPALFATALTTHGIGYHQRNKAQAGNTPGANPVPARGLAAPRALQRRASLSDIEAGLPQAGPPASPSPPASPVSRRSSTASPLCAPSSREPRTSWQSKWESHGKSRACNREY